MFFNSFTLCNARVSALVIVLSDSPRERIGKCETSPVLKEDIVGARLARASVTKTAQYWVYGERQFLRLCRHLGIVGGTMGENQH
jgi:hypothetical protein